jgi:hypothetical protein
MTRIDSALPRRSARSPLLLCALAAVYLAYCPGAFAQRAVRWNEVTVTQGESAAAFQEAMRVALVRATGKRDADSDPALGGLLSQPRRYVQVFRPAAAGGTQIVFDAAAIERAVATAGRSIWGRERPLVLVVLQGDEAAKIDEHKKSLTEVAQARGLPVSLTTAAALELATSGEITREAALPAAQRMGADAVLVGDGSSAAVGGGLRWSLYAAASNENWSGALADGVHGAADALVRAAEAVAALPEIESIVEIAGVTTLKDFATVSNALTGINGVRRTAVFEASSGAAVFRVAARGGLDTVMAALTADTRFERVDPVAGGAIAFRYRR